MVSSRRFAEGCASAFAVTSSTRGVTSPYIAPPHRTSRNAMLTLKTVTRTQGNNRAFKEGVLKPKFFVPEIEEVDPLIAAFRRMVRENAYDICEMAITTYIC